VRKQGKERETHLEATATNALKLRQLLRRNLLVLKLQTLEVKGIDVLLVLVLFRMLSGVLLVGRLGVVLAHEERVAARSRGVSDGVEGLSFGFFAGGFG
jgi:hypothetical protein